MREGDCFIVDLSLTQERREIIPYVRDVMEDARDGNIRSPGGFIRNEFYTPHEPATCNTLETTLKNYIFDIEDETRLGILVSVICFMVNNPANPNGLNPYNPQAVDLLEQFTSTHGELAQLFAAELWEYELRDAIKNKLKELTNNHFDVRIIGQLAAGKTTFLHTVERELHLEEAHLGMVGFEPNDSERYYPELDVINQYRYGIGYTRGEEATLGTEQISVFSFTPETDDLDEVTIHGGGGHIQAEKPPNYHTFGASALFIDYQLMHELARLDLSEDPEFILSNHESVKQTVLSLLARLTEWNQVTGPKLGVVTKLPSGQNLSPDILNGINSAYARVLAYARDHFGELNREAMWYGFEITVPDSAEVIGSTDNWLPIYNDNPTCTGTIDVLRKLIALAQGQIENTENVELVHFGEEQQEGHIHFQKVLNRIQARQ